jgi:hypothetical protein
MNARVQYECFGAPLAPDRVAERTADAPQPDLPWLAWSTVRQHNHRDSAWIVVDGIVYDVTAYLRHHPGSDALLLIYAGRDATKAFHFAHSSQPGVQALLAEMRIGRVPAAEPDAAEPRVDAALRTLNSMMLLERLASCEAIVRDDDLSFRPWRARIVTASWLGHIKEGVLPLIRASLVSEPASGVTESLAAALGNTEFTLNHVERLARSQECEQAYQVLQTFTGPILAWLLQAATAPSDLTCHAKAILQHMIDFRAMAEL